MGVGRERRRRLVVKWREERETHTEKEKDRKEASLGRGGRQRDWAHQAGPSNLALNWMDWD